MSEKHSYTFNFNKSVLPAEQSPSTPPTSITFRDPAGIKKDKKRNVVNQIFYDLIDDEKDEYWRSMFLDMSVDNFPQGYQYMKSNTNGYGGKRLVFKRKNKNIICQLPDGPTSLMISTIKEFMFKCSGIQSYNDRETVYNITPTNTLTWKNICLRPKEKKMYIDIFVKSLVDKHKLSANEIKSLNSTIDHARLVNYLNADHVIFKDNHIVEIVGLQFDEATRTFKLDFSDLVVSSRNSRKEREETPSKHVAVDGWHQFLKELKKQTPVGDREDKSSEMSEGD